MVALSTVGASVEIGSPADGCAARFAASFCLHLCIVAFLVAANAASANVLGVEVVEMLLSSGPQSLADLRFSDGRTALEVSAFLVESKHSRCVLLAAGADAKLAKKSWRDELRSGCYGIENGSGDASAPEQFNNLAVVESLQAVTRGM